MATSSRIFIRNLPPSLSDSEFRSHFSRGQQQDITDARFFPNRRIGYVGYKSTDDAAAAVKYFNKSFIRMSRIAVELANPYAESETPKQKLGTKTQNTEIPDDQRDNPLKRKREDENKTVKKGSELTEFLKVMRAPNKTRTWQNEVTDGVENVVEQPTKDDDASDDDIQVISASQKSQFTQNQDNGDEGDWDTKAAEEGKIIHNFEQSDDAWLRSRTTGLVDGSKIAQEENEDDEDKQEPIEGSVSNQTNSKASSAPMEGDGKQSKESITEPITPEDKIREHGRLYVRNLPFKTTEDDLRKHFSSFGSLDEVHLPMDSIKGIAKGFAFILFSDPEHAVNAYQALDGNTFQGRLIHIIPADQKRESKLDEFAISQLPLKQQQKIRRKMESTAATYKWNPLYMNMDDVMSSVSTRLGVPKSELFDATSGDAAVKQALAETHIIQEAKSYFAENGVDLDSFRPGRQRGDTTILVKNFPYGTSQTEIRAMFDSYGQITRLLIPPSGTMALVEFAQPAQGRAAFSSLKYSRIKDSILFLEKAPKDVFSIEVKNISHIRPKENAVTAKLSTNDLLQETTPAEAIDTSTLFVRNLNFTTTTEKLKETFAPLSGFVSAKVTTKPDPKHPGQILSMGFGFLEFRNKDDAQAALVAMNGYILEGHKLDVRLSQRVLDAGQERRKDDQAKAMAAQKTKVVVKNVPFETSKKEIRALLGAYGQLRSVRVPKKFDSSSRGFVFAEFTTPLEAANAISALKNTHLLGRRLHLEYATEESLDAEEEIERMQKKVGSQVDKVALQKLTGSTRKKFNVEGNEADQG